MAGSVSSSYSGDDDAALMTDINVTPLVDVVLVLLIVFMITVPSIVGLAPIRVELPETSEVTVTVDRLALNLALKREASGAVGLYLNDKPITADEFRALLKSGDYEPIEDQAVSLAADRGIAYGEIVVILDLLTSLRLTKISLDTRHVAGQ